VRGGSVNVAGPEGGCKAAADAASHVRERGSPQSVETLHKPARPHSAGRDRKMQRTDRQSSSAA